MGGVGLVSPIKEEGKETSEENFQQRREIFEPRQLKIRKLSLRV